MLEDTCRTFEQLAPRGAPRTRRVVIFANHIDQVDENSGAGEDGGAQGQHVQKRKRVHSRSPNAESHRAAANYIR